MGNLFGFFGTTLGFLSVAIGSFAAHALKEKLTPYALSIMETGVKYQMYHALALILVSLHLRHITSLYAGWCFLIGTLIFSGSLYALAFTEIKFFGAITPIGGMLLLVGWVLFALGFIL